MLSQNTPILRRLQYLSMKDCSCFHRCSVDCDIQVTHHDILSCFASDSQLEGAIRTSSFLGSVPFSTIRICFTAQLFAYETISELVIFILLFFVISSNLYASSRIDAINMNLDYFKRISPTGRKHPSSDQINVVDIYILLTV